MRAMRAAQQERFARYVEERNAVLTARIEDTRKRSQLSREQAHRIRRSFR
jgi:hypothetical protein